MKIVMIGASWAPKIDRGVWLVGDSVFPGQSTAGVTLGALRVVREIERSASLTGWPRLTEGDFSVGQADEQW